MPDLQELNAALAALETELDKLKSAAAMIGESRTAATENAEAARKVVAMTSGLSERFGRLAERVEELAERIEGIDFPSRFDKLDATVSGINAGVQNVISHVESVERNLSGRIDSAQQSVLGHTDKKVQGLKDEIREMISAAQMETNRKLKVVTILCVGSVMLALIIAGFLLFAR